MKSKENKLRSRNLTKNNNTQNNQYNDSEYTLIKNSKSTENFIRHTDSEYYTEALDKTSKNHRNDESMTKKVSLTHHKDLSLPSNKKFV